eukprot:TRINITY_DN17520_c0_g1_i2.p1 TRINITY_DN17520_c0_g1~~TRINITY_DN17520_c0_g1_i2.p1  ORF type:complete len:249 (-),score=44.34 TRINITY_DN17520_c0_g1_i2:55-801(-)
MDPFKDSDREMFLRQRGSNEMIALARKGPFDYCRAMCRTSSRSIHAVNKYRNDEKYCYGGEAPVIMAEKALLDYNVGAILTKRSDETKQVPLTEDIFDGQTDTGQPNKEVSEEPSVILESVPTQALESPRHSTTSSSAPSTSSSSPSTSASTSTSASASTSTSASASTSAPSTHESTSTRRHKLKPIVASMPKLPDLEKDAVYIHNENVDWSNNGAASPIMSSSSIPFHINWLLIGLATALSITLSLI